MAVDPAGIHQEGSSLVSVVVSVLFTGRNEANGGKDDALTSSAPDRSLPTVALREGGTFDLRLETSDARKFALPYAPIPSVPLALTTFLPFHSHFHSLSAASALHRHHSGPQRAGTYRSYHKVDECPGFTAVPLGHRQRRIDGPDRRTHRRGSARASLDSARAPTRPRLPSARRRCYRGL